jgi:hypothetical protein
MHHLGYLVDTCIFGVGLVWEFVPHVSAFCTSGTWVIGGLAAFAELAVVPAGAREASWLFPTGMACCPGQLILQALL